MKISNRLKLIASFIDDNANIIDVGCDHALLDIFLALEKRNIHSIASDINPNPLKTAKKNIDFYGVSESVAVKLGDGITNITDATDTIVIAGLGGETIVDILKKDQPKLKNVKTIIISPHSYIYETRKYLTEIGFMIKDEKLFYDQNKPYVIIKFVRGQKTYGDDELFFGPIILKNRDDTFQKYYKALLAETKKILNELPDSQTMRRIELQKLIERLDCNTKV